MNNFNINRQVNPKGVKKSDYDAIIVGAGIGGLVCGCYLAKAGMKVLIVEKNDKPGGYCTSFEREGFRFDACVHGLGGMYEGGNLRKIKEELELDFTSIRLDPSDVFVTPDCQIYFWNELKKTIHGFQEEFPLEAKSIELFFSFINKGASAELFTKSRGKTFRQLLDGYFKDEKLKRIISFSLGNLGVSAEYASAFASVLFFREFMLNGGFYPIGGMQSLPDSLLKKFEHFGGEMVFSEKAGKVVIEGMQAKRINISDDCVKAKKFIFNCDVRHVYLELIGTEYLKKEFVDSLDKKVQSPSALVVYIGLKDDFKSSHTERGYALWYMPTYDVDNIYLHNSDADDIDITKKNLFCSLGSLNAKEKSYNKNNLHLLMIAPFKNETFWLQHKDKLSERLIGLVETLIPYFRQNIVIKEVATPISFSNYTLGYKGAAYGWAASLGNEDIIFSNPIKNVFIVGHWSQSMGGSGGVNSVAVRARRTARAILRGDSLNV